MLIRRRAGGLHQINIVAADGLVNLDLSFTIRKAPALIERWPDLEGLADRRTNGPLAGPAKTVI